MSAEWRFDQRGMDWVELSALYLSAGMGEKKPEKLELVFANSLFKVFLYDDGRLIGAGRALADGADCSYICTAIHPDLQGMGTGRYIVAKLCEISNQHTKIILYSVPGKESFYKKIGFRRITTAMAIFKDQKRALRNGLVDET